MMSVTIAATKMSNLLREQYLSAIVVQDQAFFDRIGPGEIVTRASKDIDSVRTGLGERLGYLIWSLSSVIAVGSRLMTRLASADNVGLRIGFRPRSQARRCIVLPDPIHNHHVYRSRILVRLGLSGQVTHGRQDVFLHRADPVVCPNRPVFRHGA